MTANTLKPPQHIGYVGTEDPAIGVNLVYDNPLQRAEKLGPSGMIGQDTGVEHVRVGEDAIAFIS